MSKGKGNYSYKLEFRSHYYRHNFDTAMPSVQRRCYFTFYCCLGLTQGSGIVLNMDVEGFQCCKREDGIL